ncbi:hypothetical protein GOHSU_08_00760 [Gordonia hirsuta DSM 44140 = NBRC 16056]|uniref:Mce-associated membrane protein n=1 Tax=Gordonia hirsuta DSM 44140 = NBRC 16056 TaxID=1121927 RepID=L7L954_9ACTN|nr:hypothetical protein [Gordonia hirsuta]GAC56548.1 hypothetical protein GOHSU_08_00760 [Gordonia hirsuta DSM 44140 = NBRC 16056]
MSDDEKNKYGDLPAMEIRTAGSSPRESTGPSAAESAQSAAEPAAPAEPAAEQVTVERSIVETTVDLTTPVTAETAEARTEARAATERLRAARGQTGRTRPREEAIDLTADRTVARPPAVHPLRSAELSAGSGRRFSRALLLWLIAAILGGIAAVLAWHPGAVGTENRAFVNNAETTQVMSQVSDKGCLPFTYKWRTATEDLQRADASLTGQAQQDFRKVVETNRTVIVQSKADSACQADNVAIASLTKDQATAIATLIVSVTTNGQLADQTMVRLQYLMEKHGDQWKIAQVLDVD